MGNRRKADTGNTDGDKTQKSGSTDEFTKTLGDFATELIGDLKALRAGKITVRDARARAMLAREILRATHIQMEGMKFLAGQAKPVEGIEDGRAEK